MAKRKNLDEYKNVLAVYFTMDKINNKDITTTSFINIVKSSIVTIIDNKSMNILDKINENEVDPENQIK